MLLKSIYLRRNMYGVEEGKLKGNIDVGTSLGEIKLILTEEKCQQILNLVADALVEQTKEVAQLMTAELIEGTPQLEHKEEEI